MWRLRKYLYPYFPLFVLTLALLFVQANAELALPDYMSRIVNNGIQQGGVEHAAPDVIRESSLEKALLFLTANEQAEVLANYTRLTPDSAEYGKLLKTYPNLNGEAVYQIRPLDQEAYQALNPVIGKALVVVSGIRQTMADPESAPAFGDEFGFDLSILPEGADLFEMIASLPEDQRVQLTAMIDQQFAGMENTLINQMAVVAVKAEYAALGVDQAGLQSRYILGTGGLMLLISLLGGVCTIAVGYLAARTAAGVARDIRDVLFEKVERFASAEFSRFSTASLITRSTNDVTQLQMVTFMIMRMVFYAPIIGVGGIIRAIGKSASMWWLIALAVGVLLVMIITVFIIALPRFQRIQSLIDRLNLVTRENLSGMMVIRAFNKQGFEEQRFDKANRDLTDNSLFVARVMVTMMPLMMLVMNGLTIAILWVGAQQVAASAMQVGDMIAFLQYAMQIVFAFLMLTMMFIFLPRAAVSATRIAEVLETEATITDPEKPAPFTQPFDGTVEFEHVSFKYPGAEDNVIEDITFTALPGQTTAIIGSTGCGKSTVVNLIPRFYDVTEGRVLVNGTDIRSVRQSDLRDKIGYVPQKGLLFSGTIESNLRYADRQATEEDLTAAAEVAQSLNFIQDMPAGFDSEIAQGGSNVSGGQKQRLAIARALVKKPPIFIFDDSFSALDFKTDSALRRALKARTGESTVLIVTQRVATVKNADQIIVLDEGKIVGKGTHKELMAHCQTYQEIAHSQLSQEELS
jgi:ATP-binding cassette subfamily B protein